MTTSASPPPGYTEFRGPQLDVIQSSLEGRDTLLVMATGAGKSLCMQASNLYGCTSGRGARLAASPLAHS